MHGRFTRRADEDWRLFLFRVLWPFVATVGLYALIAAMAWGPKDLDRQLTRTAFFFASYLYFQVKL